MRKYKDSNILKVGFVEDKNGKLICFRCMTCNKFIKRSCKLFLCPHCFSAFMPGISKEDIEETLENINIL